jgi:hypothetical protein
MLQHPDSKGGFHPGPNGGIPSELVAMCRGLVLGPMVRVYVAFWFV